MANGRAPFRHKLLLANSGRDDTKSSLLHTSNTALVELNAPYSTAVVLDNFFGCPFNGLNDVEVLEGGEGGVAVFSTDVL